MSVERAMKAIHGEQTDYIPIYDVPNHRGFLLHATGTDPLERTEEAVVKAVKLLDIDMLMCDIPEQTAIKAGDANVYGLNAIKWRHTDYPYYDIHTYDPGTDRARESSFGMRAPSLSEEECVRGFREGLERNRRLAGGSALCTGYTFTTCLHYAAEDLNWEEFLMACVTDQELTTRLLDRFQAASQKLTRAWAAQDIPLMLCHDDIAVTTGTLLSAEWMCANLIPRYREIFLPLKSKGIPVLFMTDGNFLPIVRDLVEAGADGFFLDTPCVTLEDLVPVCGLDLIYVTGPSPAVMTLGTPDDVRSAVQDMAETAKGLPRFFFHMPGGYAHNMPTENVIAYYKACREYGRR
jgi:hypothetical protein